MKRTVFVLVLYIVCGTALAQETAGDRDTTGTVPTIFIPRLSFRYEHINFEGEDNVKSYILRGDYPVKERLLLQAELPYVEGDVLNVSKTGWGDFYMQGLWLVVKQKKFAAAIGSGFILDTASEPVLGAGKNIAVPIIAAAYSVSRKIWILGVLQQVVSVSGEDEREDINRVSLLPGFYYRVTDDWFMLLQPVIQNDVSAGGGDVTFNMEFSVGRKMTENIILNLRAGAYVSGEKNENSVFSGEIRYLFL